MAINKLYYITENGYLLRSEPICLGLRVTRGQHALTKSERRGIGVSRDTPAQLAPIYADIQAGNPQDHQYFPLQINLVDLPYLVSHRIYI